MKKLFALVAVAGLTFSLIGCGAEPATAPSGTPDAADTHDHDHGTEPAPVDGTPAEGAPVEPAPIEEAPDETPATPE